MFRVVTLVPVVMLAFGQVAAGQTPFVANHLVSDSDWVAETTDAFPYTDIIGSEQTLDIPAGTALITWTSTMFPNLVPWIRPRIGDSFPAEGTIVCGYRSSGSWLTTTEGGTVTIALQVKNDFAGQQVGQAPDLGSLSWSLVVVPDPVGNVPAIGTVGLAVMALLVLSAGAVVLSRRKQPIA